MPLLQKKHPSVANHLLRKINKLNTKGKKEIVIRRKRNSNSTKPKSFIRFH